MSTETRMHIAIVLVDLHLPGVNSLKGKRGLVRKAIATLVNELGASVAEVDHQDTWQRCALGATITASTESGARRAVDRVRALVERDPRVVVTRTSAALDAFDHDDAQPELGSLADVLGMDTGGWSHHDTTPSHPDQED